MIDNQEKVTDNIYEVGYFNSNGKINYLKVKSHLFFIFVFIFIACLFTSYYIQGNELDIRESFISFYLYNAHLLLELFTDLENMQIESWYVNTLLLALIPSLIVPLLLFLRVYKNSKFQAVLSSVGLSQYYFYKRKKKQIYLKFKKGSKNEYKRFNTERESICQLLNVPNIKFTRWRDNGVLIQIYDAFPSKEELSDLKVETFLKKEHIFLGIGLPKIDEEIDKRDRVKKRFVARYMPLSDLPQGVANLGSSGGGKSNSMNQYLYSIFYNFNLVHSYYMVDFKGGIEASAIAKLEAKYQSGKIFIYEDSRVELFKTLKSLYLINKARMQYIKSIGAKKLTHSYIVLIFDELAEILDYTPTSKDERQIQEKIVFYIESLLRTGRSQGFKIIYSTQSYLSSSSGLTSGMKNNTLLKISHQLSSNLHVGSIKPVEELAELGIENPTKFDVGRNVVFNEANNTFYECRSLYVKDDFINDIQLEISSNNSFEETLKPFYLQTLKMLEKEGFEDDIYPIKDIASDLELEYQEEVKTIIEKPKVKLDGLGSMIKKKNQSDSSSFLENLQKV